MLRPLFFSLMLPVFAVPAMAQDVKQEVEKVGTAYQECMGKHDAACVASLYSKDGVQINPGGVFSDIKATTTKISRTARTGSKSGRVTSGP